MNTTHPVFSGHVEKNVIVLDEAVQLPDGAKVMVIITGDTTTQSSGLCGIWKDDRQGEAIIHDIVAARSVGRDFPDDISG